MNCKYFVAAGLVTFLASGSAMAQYDYESEAYGSYDSVSEQPKLIVGAGAGFATDYEGSDDYEVIPLGYFRYEGETYIVQSSGPGVEVDFLKDSPFSIGPVARYHGGREDVDDSLVDRLNDVDATVDVGVFVGGEAALAAGGTVSAKIAYLQDLIENGHEGYQVEVSAGYAVPLDDKTFLTSQLGTSYGSDDYVDSLFSINAAEATRSGLNQFEAGDGFKDVSLSMIVNRKITNHWSVSVLGNYTNLLGDAADSPIVDDRGSEHQLMGGAALLYSF